MTDLIQEMSQILYSKNAENIIAIDVRGVSTLTNYLLIATGRNVRHLAALGQEMAEKLVGRKPAMSEGAGEDGWTVHDYGDIMVHLFTEEQRNRYRLEGVWEQGRIVPLNLNSSEGE